MWENGHMMINLSDIRSVVRFETRRTGSPVHDEDLEQDVALHALEAFRRIGHVTHPLALLRKIAHDTVRDHWRRRHPSEDLEMVDERFVSQRPNFENDLDFRRQVERLHRAMNFLSPGKRAVLDLFYVQDHSIPEIAHLRGKSVSAVKMELLRARQSLARMVRALARKKSP
jgi:RNA polymerase sigma factor (sigma-70 family)